MTAQQSPLEAKMQRLLWCYDIDGWEREYKFALPSRQFRADFAFVAERVLVEVDGGQWHAHGGRHNTDKDREKLNLAAALGYRVLRFSGAMLDRPDECAEVIKAALEWRESDARR
jgi:very-short-patch-repair endonuclease